VNLPELLRHLDAHHETRFGINARVLQTGRIATGEAVATDPAALRR
jgi:MOSC domain-containing protein YiiM